MFRPSRPPQAHWWATDGHIRSQLAWLEEIGATDLSLNFRYGDLDTASVRRSMERIADLAGLPSASPEPAAGSAPV